MDDRIDHSTWLQQRLPWDSRGGGTSPHGDRAKMTGNEFKTARITCLSVSQAELGRLMDNTSRRTIQDIEALGDRPVRGVYSACLRLLIERHRWAMQETLKAVDAKIARDYPNGIPGSPEVPMRRCRECGNEQRAGFTCRVCGGGTEGVES